MDLQAELDTAISTVNSLTQQLADNQTAVNNKDDIINDKDDIIRDLKAKLEAAPENVQVDADYEQNALAAHNQTKAELNALKVHHSSSYLIRFVPSLFSIYLWVINYNYTGWSKKSFLCDLEEKCLRNSKIFFDGVFLSIYSHLLKK